MRRVLFVSAAMAALSLLIWAAPAAAFPLTNCTLQAASLKADGSALDSIAGGAIDATQEDPFIVDWDGTITYQGGSDIEMKNNTWSVSVFNIPTPLSGGDDNPEDNRTGSGTVGVSENAPFRITGLYYVAGALTGSGGTCSGSGWFKLSGDPIGTIPFWFGLGLTLLGAAGLARGARGHLATAIAGGILAGFGIATLAVIYSSLPLGSLTPIVALILGIAAGIVIAGLARRGGKDEDQPTPA
jgi:hypothetical protein